MTSHCRHCGSEICNHGNCPECHPCTHCNGGDRSNKAFEDDADREMFGNHSEHNTYFRDRTVGDK